MAILVTGGTGFVGLNLVEALLARGDTVVVLSNGPLPRMTEPAFAGLPGRLTMITGDVRDAHLVADVVRRHAVERIVHGAAVTADRRREARSPALILEVNLLGLVHVLEAARDAGVLRVLLIGSAAAYGRRLWQEQQLEEAASADPDTLYAISKAASEQILWRLGDLYRLSVVVGRLATVFGPFEWPGGWRDTLSPILQVTEVARAGGRAVLPREDRRDWLYSRDAAAALLQLLDAAAPAERLYNLGSGDVWSLAAWCVRLARRYPGFTWSIGEGSGTSIELHAPSAPAALSQQRFAAEFGSAARHDLDRAFEDYLAWLDRFSRRRSRCSRRGVRTGR